MEQRHPVVSAVHGRDHTILLDNGSAAVKGTDLVVLAGNEQQSVGGSHAPAAIQGHLAGPAMELRRLVVKIPAQGIAIAVFLIKPNQLSAPGFADAVPQGGQSVRRFAFVQIVQSGFPENIRPGSLAGHLLVQKLRVTPLVIVLSCQAQVDFLQGRLRL